MHLKIFIFIKIVQYKFMYILIYNNTFLLFTCINRKLYMIINNLIINRNINIKLPNHLHKKH